MNGIKYLDFRMKAENIFPLYSATGRKVIGAVYGMIHLARNAKNHHFNPSPTASRNARAIDFNERKQ